MNSASGSSASVAPMKKFVSETEIEEKRKKRQEEWEKVRQPNQPLEAPEEPVETRSLYEQLQAQKDMKQLEYEESHKFKNQIHGLDNEEAEFLDFVSERRTEVEKERQLEELEVLQEYRNSVASRTSVVEPVLKQTEKQPAAGAKKRSSQAALLVGAVKRKRSNSASEDATDATSLPSSNSENTKTGEPSSSVNDESITATPDKITSVSASTDNSALPSGGVARVVGILPGLGVYTDSEASDSSSSDSEIDTDIFRRDLQPKSGQDGGGSVSVGQRHR